MTSERMRRAAVESGPAAKKRRSALMRLPALVIAPVIVAIIA
jgi:hypothetical protein